MSTANGSANGAPLSPQTSYSASKSAMAAIFGPDHRYSKDESKKASGIEPPSGIQGKGTTNEPYDQGNAPETIASTTQSQEPLSGAQGKGTRDEPYDRGNAGEATANNQPINTSTDAPPKSEPVPVPAAAPASAKANGDKKPEQQSKSNERGRTLAPPASNERPDRSVSPGTLDDGTHELCAGEKGESYETPRGLGRLANKVFGSKN